MTVNNAPRPTLGGFPTLAVTRQELAQLMVTDCLSAQSSDHPPLPKTVFSSNGQGIAMAHRDPEFKKAMSAADIIHADGMPVVIASRLKERPLPERIATTDFFHDAAQAAIENGLRFYLLGGSEERNLLAYQTLQHRYPDLAISGRHHGYFPEEEDADICARVVDSGTDVLWVGMGKPRQELWSIRNRESLRGIGWIKTCGGLFEFLTGEVNRAPGWMQQAGLEWFYRTLQDPRRLFGRYITTNSLAAWCLLTDSGDSVVKKLK